MRKYIWLFFIVFAALVTGEDTDCQANEQYVSCGTACPETCETVLKGSAEPQRCTMQCVSGCFCRDGLVRNNFKNNECVDRDVCRQSLLRDGGQTGGQSATDFSRSSLLVSLLALLLIQILFR